MLNLFQNNCVNSLSSLFCHSSSNTVSITVYFFAYLHSLPIHFHIFLFPVYCFELPMTRTFFFDFPRRFELSGVICLVPTRLSLDENVEAKEGGKESVPFPWSLAAHRQSLAITLRKTKCLRRRLGSYDQHRNRKNSGYFSSKSPQALSSKLSKLQIHTSSRSATKKFWKKGVISFDFTQSVAFILNSPFSYTLNLIF